MSFPHGWFELVGLKAATNSTSFSSRHGAWASQDADTWWCQELGTTSWRIWLWVTKRLHDYCMGGCHQAFFGRSLMTTVTGTAIRIWLMLPATTINHQQPLRTTIRSLWYSWSDSDYQLFHHHASDLNSWRQEHLWLRILLHLGSRWSCRPVETAISI